MFLELLIFFFTLITLTIYWERNRRPPNFPPGPQGVPFLGDLLRIGAEPHESFWKLSKQYGKIVGVNFGPDLAICLHGTQLIKEGYNYPAFSGRNPKEATSFVSGDEMGIANANGDTWVEQRRFALRHLRDFGFGKRSMEELIMEEATEFSKWLKSQNNNPVALQDRFSLAVVNSLWKIVTGERFDHDDHKLHKIIEDLERAAKAVLGFDSGKNLLIFFYPRLGKMFPDWSGWNRLVEGSQQRIAMFDRIIAEHKASFQKDAPRDFVDVYLNEIQQTTNIESSFHVKTSGVHSLKSVMADFFVAGTDTTAVTLSWLQLYLLHNPRVQAKLHKELDQVVGKSRNATLNDRKSLPFTEAVILETLRLSSIAGISVPHAAIEDTIFHGYNIPKGTLPERFLSQDELSVVRHEALMPFSIGKRVCPGETLARDSLFLFTANLALNFEVCGIPGEDLPPLDYKRGQLTMAPISSTVVMTERKK